ncbi:MAG: hypothetical protein K0Q59_2437 [Paenibacillus sp.]|jgi:hypothetical protein|nr:hypothetical protein [Paenibacillus sp.]
MYGRTLLKRMAQGTLVLGFVAAMTLAAPSGRTHAHALNHPDLLDAGTEVRDEGAEGKHGAHKGRMMFLFEDSAAIIGIGKDELVKQLESGKSIVEVAQSKGIQEDALTAKLLANRLQKIDEAVKSGKWQQEKADRIKQKLPEHLKMIVNKKDWKEWQKAKEQRKEEHAKEHGKEHGKDPGKDSRKEPAKEQKGAKKELKDQKDQKDQKTQPEAEE